MVRRGESYGNLVQRLFPDPNKGLVACRNVTFQITDECNLRCSYCYEHHKCSGSMSFETGKKAVNYLLNLYEQNDSDFINHQTKGIILDFIGGEPLLEAELIEKICDYWFVECWRRKIPLAAYTRISFATNGQSWFTPAAQHLFEKYHDMMSVTVSIDGVKELHDRYRLTPDGFGSFDKAFTAFRNGKQKYGWTSSKMTFVPGSFLYIYPSVKQMVEEGCRDIYCNYAYEPVYTKDDAKSLYCELKKVANYVLTDHPEVWVSILSDTIGEPALEDHNWCGGTGDMLSIAPDGSVYPCIRYAPISIGKDMASKICLGDCYNGLYVTDEQIKTKELLDSITLTSQSTDECINCPVASGCGWCSGYNYELFGTPNKRATHICLAHKARVLASCYYYNRRYLQMGDCEPKAIYLPRSEAIDLVGESAANELWALQEQAAEKFEKEKGGRDD